MVNVTVLEIKKVLHHAEVTLYPTLLQVGGRNYLIDCGYEETFDEFVAALASKGVQVKELHAILLSHDDIDHLGALPLFKQANQALLVYCSESEAPSVVGQVKSERLQQAEQLLPTIAPENQGWALAFINQLQGIKRIAIDFTLRDNDRIENEIVVVATPGHTKGHLSFHLPSQKILIAGDALVIENGELALANPAFTLDIQEALRSVEKISRLKPEKVICYHGGVSEHNLAGGLRDLLLKHRTHHYTQAK